MRRSDAWTEPDTAPWNTRQHMHQWGQTEVNQHPGTQHNIRISEVKQRSTSILEHNTTHASVRSNWCGVEQDTISPRDLVWRWKVGNREGCLKLQHWIKRSAETWILDSSVVTYSSLTRNICMRQSQTITAQFSNWKIYWKSGTCLHISVLVRQWEQPCVKG